MEAAASPWHDVHRSLQSCWPRSAHSRPGLANSSACIARTLAPWNCAPPCSDSGRALAANGAAARMRAAALRHMHGGARAPLLAAIVAPLDHQLAARLRGREELHVGIGRDAGAEFRAEDELIVQAAGELVDDVRRDRLAV